MVITSALHAAGPRFDPGRLHSDRCFLLPLGAAVWFPPALHLPDILFSALSGCVFCTRTALARHFVSDSVQCLLWAS